MQNWCFLGRFWIADASLLGWLMHLLNKSVSCILSSAGKSGIRLIICSTISGCCENGVECSQIFALLRPKLEKEDKIDETKWKPKWRIGRSNSMGVKHIFKSNYKNHKRVLRSKSKQLLCKEKPWCSLWKAARQIFWPVTNFGNCDQLKFWWWCVNMFTTWTRKHSET